MRIDLRKLLARASADLQGGRHEIAQDLYRKALDHDPSNAEAAHFLGLSLCQTGRGEEGFPLMRRSVELNGAEIMYRQNLGFLLSQYGFLEEAESCLREAIALQPRASLYNLLGTVLQRRGEMQRALDAYRRALALDSSDDTLQNNLGYAHFQLGEIDRAIAHYRKAIELNPTPTPAGWHALHANSLLAMNNPEAALRENALESDDQFRQMNLPLVYDALGRKADAEREIAVFERKYAARDPLTMAEFYGCRNDAARALPWLERLPSAPRSVDDVPNRIACLKNLESDSRYKALLLKWKKSAKPGA